MYPIGENQLDPTTREWTLEDVENLNTTIGENSIIQWTEEDQRRLEELCDDLPPFDSEEWNEY